MSEKPLIHLFCVMEKKSLNEREKNMKKNVVQKQTPIFDIFFIREEILFLNFPRNDRTNCIFILSVSFISPQLQIDFISSNHLNH